MRLLVPTIGHGQAFRNIISMFVLFLLVGVWIHVKLHDSFRISSNITLSAVYQNDYSNNKNKILIHISLFKAGINPELLTLAYEPEAADIYCKELTVQKKEGAEGSNLQSFEAGQQFLVLDCGGRYMYILSDNLGEYWTQGSVTIITRNDPNPMLLYLIYWYVLGFGSFCAMIVTGPCATGWKLFYSM